MRGETPRWEVLDPVVLWLDENIEPDTIFNVDMVRDGLNEAGFEFSRIQVYRACLYLYRTMSLTDTARETMGAGWWRWTGSLDLYDERRNAPGNMERWERGEGW